MVVKKTFSSPAIFQHSIPRLLLLVLVGLVLLCVAAVLSYLYGRSVERAGLAPIGQVVDLQRQLELVEGERAELHKRITKQARSRLLDQELVKAAKVQQKLLKEERSSMEEELAFLRNIVSTDKQKRGLKIQNFRLERDLEEGNYRYRFSVSQVLKDSTTVIGRIHLSVVGLQGGKKRTLKLEALTEEKMSSIKMRFRYFQEVDEVIQLPEGFVADELTLEIKPKNRGVASLTETFEWRLSDT
jgi:hypothetical protein